MAGDGDAGRTAVDRHGGRARPDDDHRRSSRVQHARRRQRVDAVVAAALVRPSGARHDGHRRRAGPARGQQAARQRGQLAPRHVEDFGVGTARGDQFAAARHGRRQRDAAPGAAAGQRALQRGRGGDRRGDARHHLAADAGRGERHQLLFEPPEHARVAALQAHDAAVAAVPHQQRVDLRLPRRIAEAALADVDPGRRRREGAQRRVDQCVMQHDAGAGQRPRAAQRDQVGRAGAGADEGDGGHRDPGGWTNERGRA